MGDVKRWTAEKLERFSPQERTDVIRAGIIADVEDVPPPFLARVRRNVRDHIASAESAAAES